MSCTSAPAELSKHDNDLNTEISHIVGEMLARVCDYHSMLLFYANILVFLKLLVFMFAVTNKQKSKYNIRLRSFRLRRAYAHRNTDCYAHARASYVVLARFLLSHVMFS